MNDLKLDFNARPGSQDEGTNKVKLYIQLN